MNVGVIGSGAVAQTLAAGFIRHGHPTMLGTRDQTKLADWAAAHPTARLGSPAEVADFAEVVVLAVKGSAAEGVVRHLGTALNGKVVIDATNPIADLPPENGVMKFFTTLDFSQMEQLQQECPGARFVKAFNSVGSVKMVNPQFAGGKPTMFICGSDAAAKQTVTGILSQFGWETADMGGVESARVIEPLSILWCIPGFLRNEWAHAFKLLR
ncbi:MAG TPA: NAD(P)-binding domain-containing protein [Steroidobacteraceae bacterium]|nr:NAD(P)-binding domain-containing protein [Steroidobacteraceae bacterium]